jgi:hypothetical protein
MNSDLLVLEQIRRRAHFKLLAAAAFVSCAGMAFLSLLQRLEYISGVKATLIAAGCILFAVLLIVALLSKVLAREYRSAFKLSVMDKLVRFLDPNLQYDPVNFVSGGVYGLANLFRRQAERYSGSDLVKGRIGEIPVEFSEVLSEYYTKGKGGRKNWITIFKGLFFVAECNRNFPGQTIVLPDVAENLLGKLGQALQSLSAPLGQLIKFNDAEFEKYFVVYSDDEAQSRDILTPGLIGRVVEFRKKNRSSFLRLSFTGSRVFVAFSHERSFCEPPLFGPIIDFSRIGQYLEYIASAVGIIEEMNRNTRTSGPKEIDIGLGVMALL